MIFAALAFAGSALIAASFGTDDRRNARASFWQGYLLLWVAVIVAAATAATAETVIIRHDPGGNVMARADEVTGLEASGADVRIVGDCWSACTMLLKVACVSPRATLGFHAPSGDGMALQFGVAVIAGFYPPRIAAAYRADWGQSREFTVLTGRQAINMGAREC